ncbi:MAG: deoxyribose-phosphate aldolase [Anaeromyxobacteraceae bacterium]
MPLATPRDLAPLLDHTVLRPGAEAGEVLVACDEALEHGFAGVCVREEHLARVVARLAAAGPRAIVVCDFPRGEGRPAARAEEARRLAGAGAHEIDVVYPLPLLRAREHRAALDDLAGVVRAAGGAAVKVILETGALSAAEKAAACAVAAAAGAAFVKTSTGFGPGGATEEDVALLRSLVGERLGVKASGGVRSAAAALALVRAGASRIGASASVAIVTGSF